MRQRRGGFRRGTKTAKNCAKWDRNFKGMAPRVGPMVFGTPAPGGGGGYADAHPTSPTQHQANGRAGARTDERVEKRAVEQKTPRRPPNGSKTVPRPPKWSPNRSKWSKMEPKWHLWGALGRLFGTLLQKTSLALTTPLPFGAQSGPHGPKMDPKMEPKWSKSR